MNIIDKAPNHYWPLDIHKVFDIANSSYEDIYYADESCENLLSAEIFAKKLIEEILERLSEKILSQHCGDSSGWDSAIEKICFMLINKDGA